MPHRIVEFLGAFPFLLVGADGGLQIKMNWARIIEAIIIACLAGALSGYISVEKVSVKVDEISKHVDILDKRIWDHIEQTGGIPNYPTSRYE